MPRKRRTPQPGPGVAPSGSDGGVINVPNVDSGPGAPQYGQKGQLQAIASATQGRNAAQSGAAQLPANGLNLPMGGVFGPTQRPGEPPTAGAPFGPGPTPAVSPFKDDPDMFLRAIYSKFPHPDIARILMRANGA